MIEVFFRRFFIFLLVVSNFVFSSSDIPEEYKVKRELGKKIFRVASGTAIMSLGVLGLSYSSRLRKLLLKNGYLKINKLLMNTRTSVSFFTLLSVIGALYYYPTMRKNKVALGLEEIIYLKCVKFFNLDPNDDLYVNRAFISEQLSKMSDVDFSQLSQIENFKDNISTDFLSYVLFFTQKDRNILEEKDFISQLLELFEDINNDKKNLEKEKTVLSKFRSFLEKNKSSLIMNTFSEKEKLNYIGNLTIKIFGIVTSANQREDNYFENKKTYCFSNMRNITIYELCLYYLQVIVTSNTGDWFFINHCIKVDDKDVINSCISFLKNVNNILIEELKHNAENKKSLLDIAKLKIKEIKKQIKNTENLHEKGNLAQKIISIYKKNSGLSDFDIKNRKYYQFIKIFAQDQEDYDTRCIKDIEINDETDGKIFINDIQKIDYFIEKLAKTLYIFQLLYPPYYDDGRGKIFVERIMERGKRTLKIYDEIKKIIQINGMEWYERNIIRRETGRDDYRTILFDGNPLYSFKEIYNAIKKMQNAVQGDILYQYEENRTQYPIIEEDPVIFDY